MLRGPPSRPKLRPIVKTNHLLDSPSPSASPVISVTSPPPPLPPAEAAQPPSSASVCPVRPCFRVKPTARNLRQAALPWSDLQQRKKLNFWALLATNQLVYWSVLEADVLRVHRVCFETWKKLVYMWTLLKIFAQVSHSLGNDRHRWLNFCRLKWKYSIKNPFVSFCVSYCPIQYYFTLFYWVFTFVFIILTMY